MNRHDIGFEIKEVTASGIFKGYGSVYGVVDQGDDIMAKGAFTDSLAIHQSKGTMPAMLWQHDSAEPIGAYTMMCEDSKGLYLEGCLALKTQRGSEAYELMQMKALSGLSIGFMTKEDTYDSKSGIRTITKGDLWEVSLVTFPMNDKARITSIKNIDEITDFKAAERFLRESCNFSRQEATKFVGRIKDLKQSESVESAEMQQLIQALQCRNQLITS
jgi:uncharacterized protein